MTAESVLTKIWDEFSDKSIYTLMAIARKKDNVDLTNANEIVLREIVKTPEEVERKLDRLYKRIQIYNGQYIFRIYASVNARDIIKAARSLSYDILTHLMDFSVDPSKLRKLKSVDKIWFSTLNKPENVYKNKYVVLDIDNFNYEEYKECIDDAVVALRTKVINDNVGKVEDPIINVTHSGVHLIFKRTFKHSLLGSMFMENLQYTLNKRIEYDILTDSVTLIEYIEKNK